MMNHRTCPHCNYKFTFWQYLKNPFFKGVYAQWKCVNCNTCLSIDMKRRWLVSFVGIVPTVYAPQLAGLFESVGFSSGISWATAITMVLAWTLMVFSFDRFELPEFQNQGSSTSR
ncbi:TIGR04104 family putative zinc finger protein [Salinimicrobium soli]|uniref:TIGR04104 family putative zinc finger protein n=1 Tax=Salinimicrobium soli TaxID=1254399 RepID=UPI003AABDB07